MSVVPLCLDHSCADPDLLITHSIGDSQDPLDRMLAVLRFTFTKELKYVVSARNEGLAEMG